MFQNKDQSSQQTKYKENAAQGSSPARWKTDPLSSGFHTLLLVQLGQWQRQTCGVMATGVWRLAACSEVG